MHTFAHILDWIAGTLWPLRCAACGHVGVAACTHCLHLLTPAVQRCPACQRPGQSGLPCFGCRGRTHLDRLLTATALDERMGAMIHALKYANVQSLASPLTDRCCDLMALRPDTSAMFGTNPLIVPVPLHTSRFRERGYNQAELIARRVAAITAMPVYTAALGRTRSTGQQVKTAGRSERRENMRGAFAVTDSRAVAGRDIVVIDDVTTTGATLEDCARALKEAGANSVSACTLAHG